MNIRKVWLGFGMSALMVTSAMAQNVYDWSPGTLPKCKLETVNYRAWTPAVEGKLNGTLILIPGRHGDGRGMANDAKWQDLATSLRFAILACQFSNGDPGLYQHDEGGEVSDSLNDALRKLATDSNHSELERGPVAFWGTSAGSNVASHYCDRYPKRVTSFASSKGTWGPNGNLNRDKEEIPMFFAIGMKDKREWVDASTKNLEGGLKKRAPWTVALQPNEEHGVGESMPVVYAFLTATIKQNLEIGDDGIARRDNPRDIDRQKGWLGDPKTYDVGEYSFFSGSKRDAIWLPDEATAKAWQEYMKK